MVKTTQFFFCSDLIIVLHVAAIALMPLVMHPQIQAELVGPLVSENNQRLYHPDRHIVYSPRSKIQSRL